MTPERWRQITDLFHAARARDAADRAAWLDRECATDPALRAEVETLLRAHDAAEGLASAPPPPTDIPASMVGQTLQHYRIVRPLGRGGMGMVYAAQDTKLHRQVALKILPADVAADAERLHRFQREAQAIAALSHPNVVTIYSVEEASGVHFLTMELIEGKTLVEFIPPRGLPLDEFLRIAVSLVGAVSAAHDRGIVHRDLKPANVMVARSGQVKVLDFGLAKLRVDAQAAATLSALTTEQLTGPHHVMGTAAYMSPEQAEGRAVDHRSDIFSLGVLLYEMATGSRPFRGDTPVSVISSIIKDSPAPLADLRRGVPLELDRIVRRCLAKDPARRYQHALDLRNDLEELQQVSSGSAVVGVRVLRRSTRWVWVAGFAVAAVLGYIVVTKVREPGGASPLRPRFAQLTSFPGAELFPSLSPDGKWIVYSADTSGNRDVFLQSVTGANPVNLTADSPADDEQPVFSPDGERIVFRSSRDGGGLFVMGRTGESVVRVTRAGFNPTWSPDSTQIAFTGARMELKPQNSVGPSPLWVVSAKGGEPRQIHAGPVVQPGWSPHNKRVAFGLQSGRQGTLGTLGIWTMRVDGSDIKPATRDADQKVRNSAIDWNPVWAPDGQFLYFASDRGGSMNLWRVAIDEDTGDRLREPEQLTTPAPFLAHITISADGRHLAYTSVLMTQNVERIALDPAAGTIVGQPAAVTTGSRLWSSPDPSPDGKQVAFYSQVPEGEIWIARSDGTGLRRLTGDGFLDRVPRWSPDGQWIAWFSNRTGVLDIWKIRVDGSDLQQMTELKGAAYIAWSPDGQRVATARNQAEGVYLLDPNRAAKDQRPEVLPLPHGTPRLSVMSWSPDGARLALWKTPVGIGVYSLRTKAITWPADFGEWPAWLPDSRRVLFVSEGKHFFVLETGTGVARKIYSSPRDVLGPPRLTRDGRTAVYTRRVNEADVWLVTLE